MIMVATADMVAARNPWRTREVPARLLVAILFGFVAVPHLLLAAFLGLGLVWLMVASAGLAIVAVATMRALDVAAPSARCVASLALVSLVLFVLGGEGRFFYANSDWQVRDAVLRDLVNFPWPWAYMARGEADLLRVPLGMYLLPAIVGKAGGFRAAEFALLIQNTVMLTAILSLGSVLFATARARMIALIVVVGFSGMDLLGVLLIGGRIDRHLEWWAGLQYSSHVTQLFWVPNHALPGWIGALLYLLWRERRLTLAGFLVPLPLLCLWSPLSLFGLLPFAAHAGVQTLIDRKLQWRDILLPAGATLIAVPALLYLVAGSAAVGNQAGGLELARYLTFEALEVGPYLLAAATLGRRDRFGGATMAIVVAILLLAPFISIGHMFAFVSRASIPALAILAVHMADVLARPTAERHRLIRATLLAALAIGAATPLTEIGRAFVLPTSPSPRCSYFGIVPGGDATYIAPLARVPHLIAPRHPALVRTVEPARCWDRPWPLPDQNGLQ